MRKWRDVTSLLKSNDDWAFHMIDDGLVKHRSIVFNPIEDVKEEKINTKTSRSTVVNKEQGIKQLHSKIYTFGGINSQGVTNNLLWMLVFDGFNFHSEPVHTLGTRPEPRYDHAMVALEEYKVIVIHGGRSEHQDHIFNDLFVFIPESLIWSKVAIDRNFSLPAISNHCLLSSLSEVYILGGLNSQGYSTFDVCRLRLRRKVGSDNSYKQTALCKK